MEAAEVAGLGPAQDRTYEIREVEMPESYPCPTAAPRCRPPASAPASGRGRPCPSPVANTPSAQDAAKVLVRLMNLPEQGWSVKDT
jgi:hypothetical protein